MDRKQTTFNGLRVAYWEGGSGEPLLLIHGSGPGASTLGNWRLVLDELARDFHVIAPDLIGFGQSDRKPEAPYFDLDLWAVQAKAALDLFDSARINVLGHSLSGYLALRLASEDARVRAVMTTGAMGVPFPLNDDLERTWSFPPTREAIVRAGESLVYDRDVLTEAYVQGRVDVLHQGITARISARCSPATSSSTSTPPCCPPRRGDASSAPSCSCTAATICRSRSNEARWKLPAACRMPISLHWRIAGTPRPGASRQAGRPRAPFLSSGAVGSAASIRIPQPPGIIMSTELQYMNPEGACPAQGLYSHATRVPAGGNTYFIAGQLSVAPDGSVAGKGSFETQFRQVFKNLADVLHGLGLSHKHLVKFTTFLVHSQDIETFMKLRAEYFPTIFPGSLPPNTLLIVDRLVKEEFLLEVEAIAYQPA